MSKSSLSDYSDAYILVKGTTTVPKTGKTAAPNNAGKRKIFKKCVPFIDCISEVSNT